MTFQQARIIVDSWFAYIAARNAKAVRLQELAALARKGPEEAKAAQAELRRIDNTPVVFDGSKLEEAVRTLLLYIDRLEHNVAGWKNKCNDLKEHYEGKK